MTRFQFLGKLVNIMTILFTGAWIPVLFAQSAQSTLKDPQLLGDFHDISSNLRCVCGKTMPLTYINDIGNCNAWAMRSVVDGLLKDGYSRKYILNMFEDGFGTLVETHKAFELVRTSTYKHLIAGFETGFGSEIIVQSKGGLHWIGLGTVGATLFSGMFLFLHKRHTMLKEEDTELIDEKISLTSEEEELLDKL